MNGSEGNIVPVLVSPSLQLAEPAHRLLIRDSRYLTVEDVPDSSIHLVITSPPYPMIQIWDHFFASMGCTSYESAHDFLTDVWRQCYRTLVEGGIACVNIGDATRSVPVETNNHSESTAKVFKLFPNHATIIQKFESLGFQTLPYILWKKPTTRTKYKGKSVFLGSGFLPTNAYVTLDVEHILIFRKGGPRKFEPKDKVRYESQYTKEQRDKWFSQIWSDINGVKQTIGGSVRRTASFPEEIPRRIIQMFSVKGDIILDPFLGVGTTMKVAAELGRNCIGVEVDRSLRDLTLSRIDYYNANSPVRRQGIKIDA